MTPFTDDILQESLKKGYKRILVAAPSFVTDCLETLIEIGEDYKNFFEERGGEKLQLVESLNSGKLWIETLASIIRESLQINE